MIKKKAYLYQLGLSLVFMAASTGPLPAQEPSQKVYLPPERSAATMQETQTDNPWQISSSVNYTTGDFGTDTTTNTVYIPVTLRRDYEWGYLSGTVPYIYQVSGPQVSAFSGLPRRIDGGPGTKRRASGMGDALLEGSYDLWQEDIDFWTMSPMARLKFPTADDDEGLGTGEFDETIGVRNSKFLDTDWEAFGDLFYTFIGEPAGTDLNNEFAYVLGVAYHALEPTVLSAAYSQRTALVDDESDPMDVSLGVNHTINPQLDLLGAISIGLSEGSPDFGISTGIAARF